METDNLFAYHQLHHRVKWGVNLQLQYKTNIQNYFIYTNSNIGERELFHHAALQFTYIKGI